MDEPLPRRGGHHAQLAPAGGDGSESWAADQAKWVKEQHDEFEAVLERFRRQRAAVEGEASR